MPVETALKPDLTGAFTGASLDAFCAAGAGVAGMMFAVDVLSLNTCPLPQLTRRDMAHSKRFCNKNQNQQIAVDAAYFVTKLLMGKKMRSHT